MFSSCASPKLTNNDRGNYGYEKIVDPEMILDINVSSLPLPDAPKKQQEKVKTFFDLRDSIPNTFLRVIAQKAKNTKEITDAIKESFSKSDNPTSIPAINTNEINSNVIKVRLLFSNIKKYYNDQRLMHPNTRLEFLTTTLKLQTNSFSIVSIDKIENEFENIDLGTLERTQNVSFNSKLSVEGNLGMTSESNKVNSNTTNNEIKSGDIKNVYDENGHIIGTISANDNSTNSNTKSNTSNNKTANNLGAKGELAYVNSENIKEALQIKLKKIKTGFTFSTNSITIAQRSLPLSDISDNIIITATLKVNSTNTQLDTKRVMQFTNLLDSNGNPNSIKSINSNISYVHYPPCYSASNINFNVDYSGAIRGVKNLKQGRNILEYDDNVVYYQFSKENVQSNPITIGKTEYCHNVFKIIAKFDDNEEYVLNIIDTNQNEVLVYDEHNPKLFLEWLVKLISEKNMSKFIAPTNLAFINKDGSKIIYLSKPNFTQADLDKLNKIKSIEYYIRKDQ